jgi:hypothetical protein
MSATIKKLSERLPKHKVVLDPRNYRMAHPIYQLRDIEDVKVTHFPPQNVRDWLAFQWVRSIRTVFDLVTGYKAENMP